MREIIFIFMLSFLLGGCYVPYPSVGKGATIRAYEVHCQKFLTNHGRVIERCRRHYR